jgi:hypothetical protein
VAHSSAVPNTASFEGIPTAELDGAPAETNLTTASFTSTNGRLQPSDAMPTPASSDIPPATKNFAKEVEIDSTTAPAPDMDSDGISISTPPSPHPPQYSSCNSEVEQSGEYAVIDEEKALREMRWKLQDQLDRLLLEKRRGGWTWCLVFRLVMLCITPYILINTTRLAFDVPESRPATTVLLGLSVAILVL